MARNKKRHFEALQAKQQLFSERRGVKPLGNAYFATEKATNARRRGLGKFHVLTDDLLLILIGNLGFEVLATLGRCSRLFYVWTGLEELWRDLYCKQFNRSDDFIWSGTWKRTFGFAFIRRLAEDGQNEVDISTAPIPDNTDFGDSSPLPFMLTDIYSDVLYNIHRNSTLPLEAYSQSHATSQEVPRLSANEISCSEFHDRFSKPLLPVIITDAMETWPMYKQQNMASFLARHGKTAFRAENLDVRLDEYMSYMTSNCDEAPLYLFDSSFRTKMHLDDADVIPYTVPRIFGEQDLFKLLGPETRPEHSWLIIGGSRSGSTFHIDPNGTSAWNAVLCGHKKWILCPPNQLPPGIFVSRDGSEVTGPLSVAEWLYSWYSKLSKYCPDAFEGVCGPGEIMFVPSGWYHFVVNLDFSVAITHNFVDEYNLDVVCDFFTHKPEQLSGFDLENNASEECVNMEHLKTMSRLFLDNVETAYPVLYEAWNKRQRATASRQTSLCASGLTIETGSSFKFDFIL